jgi:N-acetyl sugar amidotransferase
MNNNVRECLKCLMNSKSDPDIFFDDQGICNHCNRYVELLSRRVVSPIDREPQLKKLVQKIKKSGKNKPYDCIIGVSGGVDSTYVAYYAKQLGLRPLAVHFDNGWNSNLAVNNIEKTLSKLNIDLDTHVVDWEEFRDLQLSFLKASVADCEIPTDHGIDALLWRKASQHGIKFILSGMNFATESISVPAWSYGHSDWKYINDVHRKFGKVKLKTYTHFSFFSLFYFNFVKKIRIVSILNYIDFNKESAQKILEDNLGWERYGGKHYESIYTRFYQGYYLPEKFGYDKRVGHLSDLINSKQLTKEAAKEILSQPSYAPDLFNQDLDYVKKKFGLTDKEWEDIMTRPNATFRDFKNSYSFVQFLRKMVNVLRNLNLYPK